MVSRSTFIALVPSLLLLIGCDSAPEAVQHQPNGTGGSSSVTYNSTLNKLITDTPDTPPGAVDMTPPTADDASATQQLGLIMRGMNVGNYLDAPVEGGWTGDTLHGWFFEAIRQAQFDHVRIPVSWSTHTTTLAPDYTIDPVFFARVDWAVAHTLTRGMAAVLDIHHFDEYYSDPAGQHDKFLALWKQIAEHYQNYPKELIFEILNEPQKNVTASTWNADMTAVVSQIRTTNPYRTLMIGGVNYNNYAELYSNAVSFPVGDNNIIATYHYYNPYCFTMPPQTWDCGKWDSPEPHTASVSGTQVVDWPVLFPADATGDAGVQVAANNEATIDSAFQQVSTWSQTTGIPVYLGEFGADTPNRDVQSRAAYVGFMAQEAQKYGFGWANWSFIHTFAAWNGTVGWYPEIVKALTGYTPTDSTDGGT